MKPKKKEVPYKQGEEKKKGEGKSKATGESMPTGSVQVSSSYNVKQKPKSHKPASGGKVKTPKLNKRKNAKGVYKAK